MKKLRIYIVIFFTVLSCTKPLEKKFSTATYNEDLQSLSEVNVNKKDIEVLKYFVELQKKSDGITELEGKTYSELVKDGYYYKVNFLFKKGKLDEGKELLEEINLNNNIAKDEYIHLKSTYIESKKDKVKYLLDNDELDEGKNILEEMKKENIITFGDYLHLDEVYTIKKNVNNLITISKEKISQKSQKDIDENSTIFDRMTAAEPTWNNSSKIEGYVTNTSYTLTVDVRIDIVFSIKRVTTVTAWFLTQTDTKKEQKVKSIYLKNLSHGDSKYFEALVDLQQEYYDGIGGSNAEVTNVEISTTLLSSIF